MYNKKFKKLLSALLATLMLLSLSVTALAADPVTVTGAGTPEGHLDKTVTNMVLPTTTATTFAYTMDPEALIQESDAAKYAEGTTFPDAADDTHVYFLTGTNAYDNTTNTLYAVNIGNQDVTLTVKVKAVASADASKDIALVAEDALATATAASLYLGFTVNEDTKALSTTEQEFTKTIPGSDNYEVTVNESNAYAYTKKAAPDGADGLAWKAAAISLTGAVNDKSIASDTTAPTVSVTWSWAAAAEGATADEKAVTVIEKAGEGGAVTYEAGETPATVTGPSVSPTTVSTSAKVVTISNANGATVSSMSIARTNGNTGAFTAGNQYTVNGNQITFTDGMLTASVNKGGTITITFSDGNTVDITVAP